MGILTFGGQSMSIEISFTANPSVKDGRKSPSGGPEINWNPFIRTLERLIKKFDCRGEIDPAGDYFRVHFCPQGYITFLIEDGRLKGNCQTNVAGAGFHAAVADFLDELWKQTGYGAEVTDPTGYYQTRDFEKLRNENMYSWLEDVLHTLVEEDGYNLAFAITWDMNSYRPEAHDTMVFTPLGRYSLLKLAHLIQVSNIKGLADEFFIWDSRGKDARFYRNSALALLWHDCYFMPSRRSPIDWEINNEIIDLLKKAAKMDPELPFPKQEYLELCALCEKPPIDISGLSDYALFKQIGYRRQRIIETVGPFDIHIHGKFIRKYDKENKAVLFYNTKQYGYQTTAHFKAFRTEGQAEFSDLYGGSDVIDLVEFETETTRVRAALRHDARDIASDYYMIAQVLCGSHMLLCSFAFDDPDERDWALDTLRLIELTQI